jgi:hypothetical protein
MGESAAWRGAALEHAEALALFLSARAWPHISFKQAAPANDSARGLSLGT